MNTTPTSISDLISRWPTIVEFALSVGCGYEAARKMRERQSIAPEHWDQVIRACKQRRVRGVSYRWLSAQRAKTGRAA